jgi:hypothetical protein
VSLNDSGIDGLVKLLNSKEMKNLFLSLTTLLSLPLTLLNFGAGIVGALWLIISYSNWETPLLAFGVSMIAPFALAFPLMIPIIFGIPAMYLMEKGFLGKILGFPFFILAGLATWSIFTIWGMYVFDYAVKLSGINSPDLFPHLLIAYSLATSPWAYMASKEPPENNSVWFPLFFTQIAAATNIYTIGITNYNPMKVVITYIGIMLVGFVISILIGGVELKNFKSNKN